MSVHILGIRHHGPGSARNVRNYLEKLRPDIILVEGPPEADSILPWVGGTELTPPVAILCYQPGAPEESSFYPFAEFSPEWQAIMFANENKIPVKFIDLPVSSKFAEKAIEEPVAVTPDEEQLVTDVRRDPISLLADAAGFTDAEKWWEQMFEQRQDDEDVFVAIKEAMAALREQVPAAKNRIEDLRESHMRKMIREAEKEMYTEIVVVCGAWHAPALVNMPKAKDDNELLKGLTKVKIECTWVPWTYDRLSFFSGYGAGIFSPGWYHHLWTKPKDDGSQWMASVARLFRSKGLDTSVAHVIEAVRLAETVAAIRGMPKAGLEELNEATLSVLCNGEPMMMSVVNQELIVSNRIGHVPDTIPKPPLLLDIEKTQKRLRLPVTADWKDQLLDLRKETDLEKSVFLHRLRLLGINWGQQTAVAGKGTFKEQWRLQWSPDYSIRIIELGTYGNTTPEAATRFVMEKANGSVLLSDVSELLALAIPAELPDAVNTMIARINNLAAASGDVIQLMEVIPGLVSITRYGNVRKTDAVLVSGIAESMVTRICISLPPACTAVTEDSAAHLVELIRKLNDSVVLLQIEALRDLWFQTLDTITHGRSSSPVIAGYTTRLLADQKIISSDEQVKLFHYSMSAASGAAITAAWLEGFLKGTGTLLVVDDDLRGVVDDWIKGLGPTEFEEVLPLLRRTFSNFTWPERRKIGEKIKAGERPFHLKQEIEIDVQRGKQGVPLIFELFGLKTS